MSARDDLHELVRMTALVLRRGTLVGGLASVTCATLLGALLFLAFFMDAVAGPDIAAFAILPAAVVGLFAVGGVVASFLAAFTDSFDGRPRFGSVLRRALLGGPAVLGVAMLSIVPIGLVAGAIAVLGVVFRNPGWWSLVLAPPGVCVLLFGVWVFGRHVLVGGVAFFVDSTSLGALARIERQLPGHEAVVFVTGAAPLLGFLTVVEHAESHLIVLPLAIEPVVAWIATAAILFGTLAVATGAYAVIYFSE
jgi:hypothetical protein